MRNISIREDIEVVILEMVKAIPEVFLDYDVKSIELVPYHEDGLLGSWDIVFVESDESELVIGEATLGSDLFVEFEIFSEEIEDEKLVLED